MKYKLCKFCENRARDMPLWGVYIPDFGQIWVKISILGVLHPCRCTDGGEIWHGGGDQRSPPLRSPPLRSPPPCQISPPSVQHIGPAGKKPQNWPLSKLNTSRFALCAMLPVIIRSFARQNFGYWLERQHDSFSFGLPSESDNGSNKA